MDARLNLFDSPAAGKVLKYVVSAGRAAGETSARLNLVATWREATEAERAALELAEQGTRIADAAGGVPGETWANAVKHYDDEQLAALVSMIAVINAVNRMNVMVQQPAGGLPARPVRLRDVS
jgi:alkylhydroperoxidase family enzyme